MCHSLIHIPSLQCVMRCFCLICNIFFSVEQPDTTAIKVVQTELQYMKAARCEGTQLHTESRKMSLVWLVHCFYEAATRSDFITARCPTVPHTFLLLLLPIIFEQEGNFSLQWTCPCLEILLFYLLHSNCNSYTDIHKSGCVPKLLRTTLLHHVCNYTWCSIGSEYLGNYKN